MTYVAMVQRFMQIRPEVNAHKLYAGPGDASILAAAQAWEDLSDELLGASRDMTSTVITLTTVWRGAASDRMTQAAMPYLAWLHSVTNHANLIAGRIRQAAQAYQDALTAMVPPPVIAQNIAQRAMLIQTNQLGVNAHAIAVANAQYRGYWANNARAMAHYAVDMARAMSSVLPFEEVPTITNETGPAEAAVEI